VRAFAVLAVLIVAELVAGSARGGHEFPVYPSYYPHEIRIEALAPAGAFDLLLQNKLQAYIGPAPAPAALPDTIGAVESLGSYVVVRVNPGSPLARDEASACSLSSALVREIATHKGELRFHPYPVTPLHGDFIYHVDLAEAAKARYLDHVPAALQRRPKVHARDPVTARLAPSVWITQREDWDAEISEVSADSLLEDAAAQVNGSPGPPWLRSGWFQASLLLGASVTDPVMHERVQSDLARLEHGDYASSLERVNLERELVTMLGGGCRSIVAGYTVKREYVSIDYSAGIENIGFDAITGLNSPTFIRTAKLKDFPWNGWLSLGIEGAPAAAWNPVAGFTDPFGRLMWSALSDGAVIPASYDAGWMLNRISDVRGSPSR
jgi:hypothetical protein